MRSFFVPLFLLMGASTGFAQESIKVAVLKQPPPESIATPIRSDLNGQGYRIQDDQGRTFADIWLRKAIPSSEKPSEPKGAILFPFLADGEMVGVLQFATAGHDYRDQPIAKGVYTMRYGLQPVNGDHLGVSTYRDYSLLSPVAKDQSPAIPARKELETKSALAAGTSHPAVLILNEATPLAAKAIPTMIRDAEKNTWSVAIPLNISVNGKTDPIVQPVLLVVVGAAPV